jgi:hypothetical protein
LKQERRSNLERLCEALQVGGRQVRVQLGAALGLDSVHGLAVQLVVHAERNLAKQLQEAPVRVPRKALVLRRRRKPDHRGVVQAQVEDGVHHARHAHGCAAAHRHQQRVRAVAKLAPRFLLNVLHRPVQVVRNLLWQLLARRVIALACLSCDHVACKGEGKNTMKNVCVSREVDV